MKYLMQIYLLDGGKIMKEALYRKMYAKLCVGISEALNLLKDPNNSLYAAPLLQKALWEAEELYLNAEDGEILGIDKGRNC